MCCYVCLLTWAQDLLLNNPTADSLADDGSTDADEFPDLAEGIRRIREIPPVLKISITF